ncbi:MAG: hypothetical protein J7K26_03500 [Candidatus Aenigmarchaeota archaeon]|nr:hypothetical protein [Candidatus Aenigmarchaeota archaeon]
MEKVDIDGMKRKEARDKVAKLPRKKEFLIETLSDGRRVFIRTNGRKTSKVNGKIMKNLDFTVHYDNEKGRLNYVDDMLMDIFEKKHIIGEKGVEILVNAIKDSIELVPIKEIYKKYPKLKEFEKKKLPGHSIEFLLVIIKVLALQEDVNYWGMKPSGKGKYEGREKPYNALRDFFIKKMSLFSVIKKHMLVPSFIK